MKILQYGNNQMKSSCKQIILRQLEIQPFLRKQNKELFLLKNVICSRYLGKNKTDFNSNIIQNMLLESLLLTYCTVLFLCTISMMLVSLNNHGSFLAEQRMALMVELVYSIFLRLN